VGVRVPSPVRKNPLNLAWLGGFLSFRLTDKFGY
jgi:hypothetical protein